MPNTLIATREGWITSPTAVGVPATDIKIALIESPAENWGLRGGIPVSEIDLGFKIDV